MILVQLNGGLGNQLFQYAAAKSLALHHDARLKCDLAYFSQAGARTLDLQHFNVQINPASSAEISSLQPNTFFKKLQQRLKPAHRRRVYREPHFHFDPHFFDAQPPVLLKGNWQSENYFAPFSAQIRDAFTFKTAFEPRIVELANRLRNSNSVAVHIRRGDYLQPAFLAYHGILGREYYNEAIRRITEKISDAVLYIFSDDMLWVQNNLELTQAHEFVSGKSSHSALEDFFLMQNCRHQIIANSSFSWWCAWLNSHAGKMVVAPKNWFGTAPHNTKDLIPPAWIRV